MKGTQSAGNQATVGNSPQAGTKRDFTDSSCVACYHCVNECPFCRLFGPFQVMRLKRVFMSALKSSRNNIYNIV